MSWRPRSAGPGDLDPRLEPVRDRGGRLLRDDGTLIAEVHLQPEVWWTGRGWLWWTSRSQRDALFGVGVADQARRLARSVLVTDGTASPDGTYAAVARLHGGCDP